MAKLSVIIPARNERYLVPTIDNIFAQARGEVEVVAVIQEQKPADWDAVVKRHPNLHTIHFAESQGMRAAINAGAASAISRGAKYLAKFDAHCAFGEGFDEILKADCDKDWVVIPRRKRLDPETFAPRADGRPDIDYHYLSFPDNVNDFGGPGLNGKVWEARAKERFGKPEYEIDSEMASQGSGYFLHAEYFQFLELMDEEHYGKFWNESQEILNKCWLSGGRGVINKKTWYAHWHKGSAGRGYHLPKDWLSTGATFTKRWLFNDAWAKQTLPFKTLIERFWPVPTWPENWEELVYGDKKPTQFAMVSMTGNADQYKQEFEQRSDSSLTIHSALYGIGTSEDIDVTDILRRNVVNNSLDFSVTNASLEVGNPFRGQKKRLTMEYSYNGSERVTVVKDERDWLIIGQSSRYVKSVQPIAEVVKEDLAEPLAYDLSVEAWSKPMRTTAQALTDLLIRRFQIPSHRLRGPMPIEVPTFHRNDLAKLFAELGFNKGCEVGVAEGKFSEILCQANPSLNLLCVDPWHAYSGNPQKKSPEKDAFAYNETKRRLAPYPNVKLDMRLSMDAVRDVADNSLDFFYCDGHHGFDYVMQDLIEWSKKVRSGGLVCGDDLLYLDEKRWGAGPIDAVTSYVKAHRIPTWFICDADRSVDFFWIKP